MRAAGTSRIELLKRLFRSSMFFLKTPRIIFTYLLLEINPDAEHNFLSETKADTLATKLISLLPGGMACDPEQFPDDHNILVGFWATMIPDELPEPVNEAVKNKLRSLTLPVLILKAECDYLKWVSLTNTDLC